MIFRKKISIKKVLNDVELTLDLKRKERQELTKNKETDFCANDREWKTKKFIK